MIGTAFALGSYDELIDRPSTWELWQHVDGDGSTALAFFPEWNANSRSGLHREATLVWTVKALNYNDAMTRYHEHMGWSPYKLIEIRND